jgi:hypothetical protein
LTEYTGDLAFYTKYLFLATLLLASLTGALALAAFLQMRDSRKSSTAAETAAKAAERSADVSEKALVELEAPLLYIRIIDQGLRIKETPGTERVEITFGPAAFAFNNYGRTPAGIASYFETVVTTNAGVMPDPIDIDTVEDYSLPEGVIVLPNGGTSGKYEFEVMSHIFMPPLDPKTRSLFFMGFTRYKDIFGNRYRTGFCFVFDYRQNVFVLIGDEPYNYRCSENPDKPEQAT